MSHIEIVNNLDSLTTKQQNANEDTEFKCIPKLLITKFQTE